MAGRGAMPQTLAARLKDADHQGDPMALPSWAEECRADTALRVSREGEQTVVWVAGEHDIVTVPLLIETLTDAFAFDDACVVVDLSEVSFMDGATVGVIIRGRSFLGQRSRALTLRAPSRCARRLLDVCGLAGLIEQEAEAASA